jgi:hypothetical protein
MFGWTRIATLAAVAAMLAMATGIAGATSKPGSVSGAGSHLTRAGKITGSAATRAALLKTANLRTRTGAARYLRSIGLKPNHLVIQRGIRNYAGANCPGAGWSCTSTAHPVIQIAAAGGSNTFQCTTASCAVVQATTAAPAASPKPATNKATCVKTTGPTQACVINQTSATANNVAIVVETNNLSGLTQTALSTAQITQQAGASNTNTACVLQNINVDGSTTAKKGAAVNVTLNAHQSVSISQDSVAGSNTIQAARPSDDCGTTGSALTQTQTLTSGATGSGSITQNENNADSNPASCLDSGPNVCLDIAQNSTSGVNTSAFNQTNTLTAIASTTPTGPVSQTQSSPNGGLLATVNQFSHGVSTSVATQTETQCEHAQTSGVVNTANCVTTAPQVNPLSQVQYGPLRKGAGPSTQGDNSGDTFTVTQSSTQKNDTGSNQTNTVQADCTTTGNCTVNQSTNENGTTTTNTQSGPSINTSINCTPATSCTTTTGFATGDVFVSVGDGLVQERQPNGTLVRTLDTGKGAGFFTTGLAISGGNLYVTDFNANDVSKFGSDGTLIGSFGSGYNSDPESIVFDSFGNAYVGQADGSKSVLKFSPSGALLMSFSPATEDRGTDWIDLAPDGCTLYYTSEGTNVKRFDVCTSVQLADFNAAPLAPNAFAVKLLPGGGALVADTSSIVRLDVSGAMIQQYGTGGSGWFSLALDPDGTSFWAGDGVSGDVTRFDLASGNVLTSFNTGLGADSADGLAVAP